MISIVKQKEYFNPMTDITAPIHVIGVGAIGSTIATMLARMGVQKINIYDFDNVEAKNVCNQEYFDDQIGAPKVVAIGETLKRINPDIELKIYPDGYSELNRLAGYVFLCVDNIDLRREITEKCKQILAVKAVFDFRMRLTDAQHYAAKQKDLDYLLKTMNFTHEEAKTETPVSACGTELNVITTVRTICSLGLSNFINLVKEDKLKKMIIVDLKEFTIDAF
ncbi:MAG: ThiF family adenylyltransferase [Clostridium sp.]|nr:ThiF family adenylyltransferase [Clostridium sp.]